MTKPEVTRFSFESIEQLDEVTHDMGWQTEYRQLEAGPFRSSFVVQEEARWFLLEEQSLKHVEVQAPSPPDMYVIALVEGEPTAVNGQALTRDHIFIQNPDAELRVKLPAGMRVPQIGIEAGLFEDIHMSVAPDLPVIGRGAFTISTAPGCLDAVRKTMREALYAPAARAATREEMVSAMVADVLACAADQAERPIGSSIHSPTARQALQRAREYIEGHLNRSIRISAVCAYAQVNLRTLQRIFTREMGMSPQQYVKARRVNAVRRRLLDARSDNGMDVTDVAVRHGFVHLGRFAADYGRQFGELPRETLRRKRSVRSNA